MRHDDALNELNKSVLQVERIRALAAMLDTLVWGQGRGKFNMKHFAHSCGTPSCIAGYAQGMFNSYKPWLGPADQPVVVTGVNSINGTAANLLGLTCEQAGVLFMGDDDVVISASPGQPGFVSPQRAAAVLRHLADTGDVDWSVAT